MDGLVPAVSALWLGVLTSISPCPLATNIAAISFIGKRLSRTHEVLGSGISYTVGRAVSYVALGALIIAGILSIPGASNFLQKYMNKLLGPLLIIVGMFLLDLLRLEIPQLLAAEKMQARSEKGGILGAGALGMVFALAFCPVSAALFFGSLIPLSLKHGSTLLLPSLYGIGTALPVMVFAVLLALGAQSIGKTFARLSQIEWWFRRITGVIFILVGIYYCLTYIFGVSLL